MNKKQTTRRLKNYKLKSSGKPLQMLTCYDFQTATLLNETELDLILVGDSLGNVILGYDTTIQVTIEDMITFSSAVKRGAKNKFVIADLPFGSYSSLEEGISNSKILFQKSAVEAVKLEGAFPYQLELIQRLTEIGIPVMGHIGLTPQSVHQQGGYFIHGKNEEAAIQLMESAKALEKAGVFSLVLECVTPQLATMITQELNIPTIGIGSGPLTDGQVLVINDLLKMGPGKTPKFCTPVINLFDLKKMAIEKYLVESSNVILNQYKEISENEDPLYN